MIDSLQCRVMLEQRQGIKAFCQETAYIMPPMAHQIHIQGLSLKCCRVLPTYTLYQFPFTLQYFFHQYGNICHVTFPSFWVCFYTRTMDNISTLAAYAALSYTMRASSQGGVFYGSIKLIPLSHVIEMYRTFINSLLPSSSGMQAIDVAIAYAVLGETLGCPVLQFLSFHALC